MPVKKIAFGVPVQTLDATQLREGQLAGLINGYIDLDSSYRLAPGLTTWKDLSQSGKPIIGLYYNNSADPTYVYAVYNGASTAVLVAINSAGTATTVSGTTLANSTPCTFTYDGQNIFVANGGRMNRVDVSAHTATLVDSGNAPDAVTHVAYLQTFLLCNGLISGGIAGDTNFSDDQTNDYEAAESWEFFNNEAAPDAATALHVRWDEVFVGGPQSFESSYNDGVTPWAVIQGAHLHWGTYAPYSVVFLGEMYMFLSLVDNGAKFIRINARTPQDISQRVETVIYGLTDAANAKAWGINYKGTPFYVCTFPADGVTWAYNLRRNEWYKWGLWGGSTYTQHPINAYAYVPTFSGGKHLVGDRTNGIIWELTGLTHNGTTLRWQLESGHIDHGTKIQKDCKRLTFRFKRGAAVSGAPTVSLELNDNNAGYGSADTLDLGDTSDPYPFIDLWGQGEYRTRQYRLTYTGTTSDVVFMGAEEEFEFQSH